MEVEIRDTYPRYAKQHRITQCSVNWEQNETQHTILSVPCNWSICMDSLTKMLVHFPCVFYNVSS